MTGKKLIRIRSLDSLRGVAALIVVINHLCIVLPGAFQNLLHREPFSLHNPWPWVYATPIANGAGSVLIFFVLSGLVLALTFVGRDNQRYAPFIIKRVMRIWPPFAAAILFSAALQILIGAGGNQYSSWFYNSWSESVTPTVVAQHLDLTQFFVRPVIELDNPMWSLVHEIRISLVFPVIAITALRWPRLAMIGSVVMLFAAVEVIGARHRALITDLAGTAVYVWLFVAGALLAANLSKVRATVSGLSTWMRLVCWVVAFAVLDSIKIETAIRTFPAAWALLSAGLGAVAITALCTTENLVTRVLETAIPTWLGRVSYSLYLVHVPIILAVFHFWPHGPYWLMAMVAMAAALVCSEIMHLLVEVPSMAAGRALAARLPRKIAAN